MNKGNKRITSRRKRKKITVKIESNTWHHFRREEGGDSGGFSFGFATLQAPGIRPPGNIKSV